MTSETALGSEFLEKLTKLSGKMRTAFNQAVTEHGLTYPRARVLRTLSKNGPVSQNELATALELEQATMVRLVDRMQEIGLVERRPDTADRRIKKIHLTAYGEEQAALVRMIANRMLDGIVSGMKGEDLRAGIRLLDEISSKVTPADDEQSTHHLEASTGD